MNHTTVAGHLGKDPEVRFVPSGQKVTTLRVAAKARKDETIWWKVTIWGELFDKMISYLKKGSSVVVVGEIMKPEIYTDREGKPQISMSLVAFNVSFSPFGRSKSGENANNQATIQSSKSFSGGGDSLPSKVFEAPAFENSMGIGNASQEEIPF
jgi:single-strand DNA-binding protein